MLNNAGKQQTSVEEMIIKTFFCFRRYAQLYSQNPAHYSQAMPDAQAVPRVMLAYFPYKPGLHCLCVYNIPISK